MNVIIVSHETTYGPQHALLDYLRKMKVRNLALVSHPISPFLTSSSRMVLYENGKHTHTIRFLHVEGPETLLFVKDALSTLFFILMTKKRFDIYVGADSLNAMMGLFLREMGIVKVVIFFSHSFRIIRFANPIKNVIYHLMDKICIHSADFVWNLSDLGVVIRQHQGVPKEKNVWVPDGIDFGKIQTYCKSLQRDPSARKKIVFLGLLVPINGVQLIIEALPNVVRQFPDVELIIIGTGPLEEELKEMTEKADLERNVKFLGYMKYDKVTEFLPKCGMGIAPFSPIPDSTVWTTDPLKLKIYMACGLPVIVTHVPPSASEISKGRAGLVINYDKNELANAIVKLLTEDDFYYECKKNAIKVASKYDWGEIFSNAFKLIGNPTVGKLSEK